MKVYILEHYQIFHGLSRGLETKIEGVFSSLELVRSEITERYNSFSKYGYLILKMNEENTGFSYGTGNSSSFIPGGFRTTEHEVKS